MRLTFLTLITILTFGSAGGQSQNSMNRTEKNNPMLCDIETGMCEMPSGKSDTSATVADHTVRKPVKVMFAPLPSITRSVAFVKQMNAFAPAVSRR